MTTSVVDAIVVDVIVDVEHLRVRLRDGRTISVPRAWFPRLAGATAEQLAGWRPIGAGEGIRWESLDEDISVAGLLRTV